MLAIQLSAAADGTFKSIVSEYTLAPDGSITQRVSKVLKYNTHHSFFSLFGETFVVYNPEFQKIKIDTSYTIQKDGTVITTPQNAFNNVLPSIAAKAPDYNKLTELVITHTGLELDATAYLEYTITTEAGAYNSLDIDEVIGVAGADIDKYQVIVNVPEGTTLRWSLTDSKVKPTVKGGRYTWTFTGIKSAKGEANTPAGYGGVPHLAATTAPSLADNLMPLSIETRDLRRAPADYLKDAKKRQRACRGHTEIHCQRIGIVQSAALSHSKLHSSVWTSDGDCLRHRCRKGACYGKVDACRRPAGTSRGCIPRHPRG